MSFCSIDDLVARFVKERAAIIEQQLVLTIEAHLGRVPSNAEVSKHGRRFLNNTNEEFFWGEHFLFGVEQSTVNFRSNFYFDHPRLD